MKVLFTCGRELSYPRNQVMLKALREICQVIEVTDETPSFILRHSQLLLKLLWQSRRTYDLAFVGFYGHLLLPWLRMLSSKPLIFDAFLSTYDTLCFDRKKFRPNSLPGKLAYWLDKYTCTIADTVLLDTQTHADYFVETFGVPRTKIHVIYLGCDEEVFHPSQKALSSHGDFVVLYYGSFLPLQGIEYIIQAAKLLEGHKDIKFKIIGKGIEYRKIRHLANVLQSSNIEFLPPVPYTELPLHIAQASLCLGGHFSSINKAHRVIASKTYQFIAMAKPTIVGDNPANRELFTHRENAYLCPMGNAEALASAILELKENRPLRQRIAENGYRLFRERCTISKIVQSLKNIIEKLI